jgi:hypothetical protein
VVRHCSHHGASSAARREDANGLVPGIIVAVCESVLLSVIAILALQESRVSHLREFTTKRDSVQ